MLQSYWINWSWSKHLLFKNNCNIQKIEAFCITSQYQTNNCFEKEVLPWCWRWTCCHPLLHRDRFHEAKLWRPPDILNGVKACSLFFKILLEILISLLTSKATALILPPCTHCSIPDSILQCRSQFISKLFHVNVNLYRRVLKRDQNLRISCSLFSWTSLKFLIISSINFGLSAILSIQSSAKESVMS